MWYTATSASVTNGATVVAVTTGDDISIIQEESGLIFEGESPVQVKRGYIDGTGDKFIELEKPWPYTAKTNQPLVAYPTDASFAEATAELRRVIDEFEIASTIEAQEGTDDTKAMSALKTKQAIDFNKVSSNTDTTAGKLLTVGYGGLGATTQAEVADLNEISSAGFYPVRSGVTLNNPLNTYHSSVLRMNSPFIGRGGELLITNSSSDVRALIRGEFGSVNSDWQELYHSGNTNFNEFSCDAAGDIMFEGFSESAARVRLQLPLNSPSTPNSISVEGTFTIKQGTTTLATGVTPTLSSLSSSKLGSIFFSVSGADTTQPVQVFSDSASSKITANY